MHSTEIPPWLRKILDESQDPDACMKAIRRVVMPLWRKEHPRNPLGPRNPPGPRELDMGAVGNAVDAVLGRLTPADRKTITWKWFFLRVQQAIGDSPNRKWGKTGPGLYDETVLRPLIWTYILGVMEWEDIPPKLFDRRQLWMPADRSLPALKKAFRREQNRPLYRLLRDLKENLKIARVSFSPRKWKERGEVTIIIPPI
jgi:hypothetical protein